MRKSLIHIALFIPIFLIMLHSVIPHHHLEQNQELSLHSGNCQSDYELFDWMFQLNPGENHLEEFQVASNAFNFDLAGIQPVVLDKPAEIPTSFIFPDITQDLPYEIPLSSFNFRGPPHNV